MTHIFTHWNELESDFQREYGINLLTMTETMMWRRFVALINGLSAESVFLYKVASSGDTQSQKMRKAISNPNDIQAAIRQMMGR